MIVVLTWYSGECGPELVFFPKGSEQAGNVAKKLAMEMGTGKECHVYEITTVDTQPFEVYPKDNRLPF